MRLAALLLGAVLLGGAKPPETEFSWDCKFTAIQSCSAAGCKALNASTLWIKLTPEQQTFMRCATPYQSFQHCDQYPMRDEVVGEFRVFTFADPASFVKVGPDLKMVQVESVGNAVTTGFGRCEEGPPPLIRTPQP